MMTNTPNCELCQSDQQTVLVQTPRWRIIDAADTQFPGFTRVIWNDHVREMTDLNAQDQLALMQVVLRVEKIMRQALSPDKVNLASLGNQVPHLHWHLIPRWQDDAAFPAPIWNHAPPTSERAQKAQIRAEHVRGRLPDYYQRLINEFALDT